MVTAREKAFTMRRAPIASPSSFLWKPVRWDCHFGSLGDADDADISDEQVGPYKYIQLGRTINPGAQLSECRTLRFG